MSDRQIVVDDKALYDYYLYLKTFLDKTLENHTFIVSATSSLDWDDKNYEAAVETINRIIDKMNDVRSRVGYMIDALDDILNIVDKY